MELTVGDKSNADPTTEDIARAIEESPKGEDWYINLQSNDVDYIEAFAEADGRYGVTCVDGGRPLNAASPVDAATLKTIFGKYLKGDPDWRSACRLVAQQPSAGNSKTSRRISSEPPVWAIVVIAVAFFSAPLLLMLPEHWLGPLPDGFGIVWFVAGPMTVMLLVMLANKMMQARRAAAWPQTAGRITRSEVAATRRQTSGRATEVINVPLVEYEFSAKGRQYTGTRISIGEDTGGANTEATLAHYPVGAAVMVYYDPDDPGNSLLERDMPKSVPLGCAAFLAAFAALGYGGYRLFIHFEDAIESYIEDGNGKIVVVSTVVGLVCLMLFSGSRSGAKAGAAWPVVPGKVVQSGTESYRVRVSRNVVTSWAPVVEYAYTVNGHEYRSRQIRLDDSSGGGSNADAKKIAARYPEGRAVEVHYDPANPGHAALEKPSGTAWYLLAIAVVCFGVSVYAGVFRH